MLEAVHIIQQAYYNFVLRRRVASLAPYTLPDKGPLQKNLRMQSVRPTLATLRAGTADEPPRCCARRSCESTPAKTRNRRRRMCRVRPPPPGDQEGTVPAIISSKSPTRHGCQANGALDGSNISSCTKDAGLDSSLYSRAECLAAVTIQRAALPPSSLAASRRPSRSCASASLRPARSDTQTPTPKPRSGRLAPRAPSTRARLRPGRCAAARWPRGRARRGGVRAMRPIFLVQSWSDSDVDQRVGTRVPTMTARRALACLMRRTQPASSRA